MEGVETFPSLFMILLWPCSLSRALDCEPNGSGPTKVALTLTVDKSGRGNFTTIQAAIDCIKSPNKQWVRILISSGTYNEKVQIPEQKPCIFLEGDGNSTIEAKGHMGTDSGATFTSYADYFIAKGIVFKNSYGMEKKPTESVLKPALAVRIYGDKSTFLNRSFVALQDTVWDVQGRHYYRNCNIEGAIDFIFGYAQSIFEVNTGTYAPERPRGVITAHGRNSSESKSGFAFKKCVVSGTGKALLGRAWGAYPRVIFDECDLSEVVAPVGYDACNYKDNEKIFVYVERGCGGKGADTSQRSLWFKNLNKTHVDAFLQLSYINEDGWINKLSIQFA